MITDSNQVCFAKMTGRRLQEGSPYGTIPIYFTGKARSETGAPASRLGPIAGFRIRSCGRSPLDLDKNPFGGGFYDKWS